MRFILFLLSIFIFVGCSQSNPIRKNDIDSDVELVREARIKVARKLKQEKNLRLSGVGSQMMDKIKMIALSFNYFGPVDEGKARELLLSATNELIFVVNEDERIRPYLHDYPFGPKNVEIRIFLKNIDGSKVSSDKLSVISVLDGILDYEVDDPKNAFFTSILEETYEEAMKKQAQSSGLKISDSETL